MSRIYDYGEFIAGRRASAAQLMATIAESRGPGPRRSRPRTDEEYAAIERAALARMRERRESGKLVEIAPRMYVLR